MPNNKLDDILQKYSNSFTAKNYSDENDEIDILMKVFSISPELKRENRQYWGRELGMCWQLLVAAVCEKCCADYKPAFKVGLDEPCDLVVGKYAIDTKYRIGSGDSGTLKKFKQYGAMLIEQGYTPIFLILRDDNLGAAISACNAGKWSVYTGEKSFDFLKQISGYDLQKVLMQKEGGFRVQR